MGSASSTVKRESNDEDPWWPASHRNSTLLPTNEENQSEICDEAHSEGMAESDKTPDPNPDGSQSTESSDDSSKERLERRNSLDVFRKELQVKRERRQIAVADLRNEITTLRKQLAAEKELNRKLKVEKVANGEQTTATSTSETASDAGNGDDVTPKSGDTHLRAQLAETQLSLQIANAEILSLNTELTHRKRQVTSLKEVIGASKQMLEIRETALVQVSETVSFPL